jgi:nucleotide-binding universal stress UspA family protein
LSKVDDAEVSVLYVIPRYEEMVGFFRTESIQKSLLGEAGKILAGAKKLASEYGVTVKTEIRDGHAADKIVEMAADLKNDLIVMGSYGWQGVNKAIMGSTAERVLINAPCPVLAVR